jgi:hypothetical protein
MRIRFAGRGNKKDSAGKGNGNDRTRNGGGNDSPYRLNK